MLQSRRSRASRLSWAVVLGAVLALVCNRSQAQLAQLLPSVPHPAGPEEIQNDIFRNLDTMNEEVRSLYEMQANFANLKSHVNQQLARINGLQMREQKEIASRTGAAIANEIVKIDGSIRDALAAADPAKFASDFDDDWMPLEVSLSEIFVIAEDGVAAPPARSVSRRSSVSENLLQPIDAQGSLVSTKSLQDKTRELNDLVNALNLSWREAFVKPIELLTVRPSYNFADWIPRAPNFAGRREPEGSDRLPRTEHPSKDQVVRGLQIYHAYLEDRRDIVNRIPFSPTNLENFRQTARQKISQFIDGLDKMLQEQTNSLTTSKSKFYQDVTSLARQQNELPYYLFLYLLVAFTVSLLGLHLIIRMFSPPVATAIVGSNSLLHVFTVFVLVAAIVILSVSGKLEGQQLSTLIAAISGYVLGQLGRSAGAVQAAPAVVVTTPETIAGPTR
jgi:hypothetical protein